MRLLAGLALAAILCAQDPEAGTSRIEGQVLNDANSTPLRRARVTLHPFQAGSAATTVEADDSGNFVIRDIAPGPYSLSGHRDGYLDTNVAYRSGLRMASGFTIGEKQSVTGVTLRLRPWAVISGKIHYDDGEPAIGVRVDIYRQFHVRGKTQYSAVAATLTNDLGEYRIHNLPAGGYYISASPSSAQPDRDLQPPVDAQGKELPVFGYATSFYPDTFKLNEAVPVHLETGRELGGIDLVLQKTRKVILRGRVTDSVTGQAVQASILLARIDAANNSALGAPAGARFDRNTNFEIRNVAPGPYEIRASVAVEGKQLIARRFLNVANENIDDIELIASPERRWSLSVKALPPARLPAGSMRVRLEPRSDGGSVLEFAPDRWPFVIVLAPNETYDVFLPNLPEDFYISAVRVSGTDVRETGLEGRMATDTPFEIEIDSQGGRVGGRVFDAKGNVMSGATLFLIPDSPAGAVQDYRNAAADEYGQFLIRGVAPGKYILTAWLDEPVCDVYDPAALDTCRAHGLAISVTPGSERVDAFTMR
jgi:hypothetical protein